MVGIGFPERNDSFDFIAGLEDFKKQLRIVNGTQVNSYGPPSANGKDFTLKEGEKISINLPGFQGKKYEAKPAGAQGGLKKLAPPPGSKKPV